MCRGRYFLLLLSSGALFLGILFFGFISHFDAGWLSLTLLVKVWISVRGAPHSHRILLLLFHDT